MWNKGVLQTVGSDTLINVLYLTSSPLSAKVRQRLQVTNSWSFRPVFEGSAVEQGGAHSCLTVSRSGEHTPDFQKVLHPRIFLAGPAVPLRCFAHNSCPGPPSRSSQITCLFHLGSFCTNSVPAFSVPSQMSLPERAAPGHRCFLCLCIYCWAHTCL